MTKASERALLIAAHERYDQKQVGLTRMNDEEPQVDDPEVNIEEPHSEDSTESDRTEEIIEDPTEETDDVDAPDAATDSTETEGTEADSGDGEESVSTEELTEPTEEPAGTSTDELTNTDPESANDTVPESASEPSGESTKTGDDTMPAEEGTTETQTAAQNPDITMILELAEFGGTEMHKQVAYAAIRDGLTLAQAKVKFKEGLESIQVQAGTIAGKAKEQLGNKYDLETVVGHILSGAQGKTAQQEVAFAIQMSDHLLQSGMVDVNNEMRVVGMPNREQTQGFMAGGGLIIPHAVMSGEATLVASSNVNGEIAIEVDESRYLDWLVEPSKFMQFTDVIRDVTSDFRIPVGSGSGPQVTYVAEDAATLTDTAATWRTVAPAPHALVGTMDYTELSNIRTGGFVSRRLGEGFGMAISSKVDNTIIQGTGVGAIPQGLNAKTTGTGENQVRTEAVANYWPDLE